MTDRSSPPAQVPTRPRCRPGKCYPPPRDIRSQERPHGRTSPAVALCPLECMGKAAGVVRWRKLQEHGRPAGGRCRGEGCQPASLHARIVRRPYSYAPMDISARATATSRRLGLHARRSSTSCCLLLLQGSKPLHLLRCSGPSGWFACWHVSERRASTRLVAVAPCCGLWLSWIVGNAKSSETGRKDIAYSTVLTFHSRPLQSTSGVPLLSTRSRERDKCFGALL
jgi:hypothetical protein